MKTTAQAWRSAEVATRWKRALVWSPDYRKSLEDFIQMASNKVFDTFNKKLLLSVAPSSLKEIH